MHFNENFGRAQATTKSGKERIKIAFPKLLRTIELCTNEDYKPMLPTAPPPLASQYEHPDKETIPDTIL